MAVLHVVCIDASRNLWHTIRLINGNWVPFGPVRDVVLAENPGSLNPGAFDKVDCAGVVNDLHLCLQSGNEVAHTIRRINGSWFPFGNLLSAARAPSGVIHSVAATQVNGQLNVCAAIKTGTGQIESTVHSLFLAIRSSTGSWRQFENFGGSFEDVACAEDGSQLHFCGTTYDSKGIRQNALEHALRPSGGGPFTPFRDVRSVVLAQNPGSLDPGEFNLVSCAGLAGELHVCTISSGRLFHTIRRTDRSWFPFGNVVDVVVAQNPGSPRPMGLRSISCDMVNGELHLICVDSAGVPWHTVRRAERTWFPFRDVRRTVLSQNPGSPDPGSIQSVAIADSF
jgi:hypothetical protein